MKFTFRQALHYHDKGFTVDWEVPSAKWVLIYYRNSQEKPWYRRTERPYRFKRFFIRKPIDTFSNLANFNSPFIRLYVFYSWLAWPIRKDIPMKVQLLRVTEPAVEVALDSLAVIKSRIDLRNLMNTPSIPSIHTASFDFEILQNAPSKRSIQMNLEADFNYYKQINTNKI